MGTEIDSDNFSEEERARFIERLDEQLHALDLVLRRPGFGACGERTLGAELELCLVDEHGRPLSVSREIVRAAQSPAITPEMGEYEIELSTPPVTLAGAPFTQLREHMQTRVRQIRALAEPYGARVVPISILPTLRREDFHSQMITNLPRYRALARGMSDARQRPFEIAIEGEERLQFASDEGVAMEAANMAFQIHLVTHPDEFTDLYNAALLLSGPVIAAAANSPTFLGKRLWHETRVALFKQAGDDRPLSLDHDMMLPARVNFGNGWVREGAHELFMESVALHSPLIPKGVEYEPALQLARSGKLPELFELRMHHGTVWTWNRPVYDPSNGGNLRIELRALPAGPSYDDMLANGCFLIGAMLGIREQMAPIVARMPFALARQNFYRCAQMGLDAELAWPSDTGSAPRALRARELLLSLLPLARSGLEHAGMNADECDRFLSIFEERVRSGMTGAVWQRTVLARLEAEGMRRDQAIAALFERYIAGFRSQRPVHIWPTDDRILEADHV